MRIDSASYTTDVLGSRVEGDSLAQSHGEYKILCYSDAKGVFDLDSLPENEFILRIEKAEYLTVETPLTVKEDFFKSTITLQEDPEAKAKMLEEVEVTARVLNNYNDRIELFLNDENRRFGLNALDAISSLPLFKASINSSELSNINGSKVGVLIDGRRASYQEICNLKGKDIRKIIYYDNPPAKYAVYFGGPVANILLKRPSKLSFNGNAGITASNAYKAIGGLGLAMMDKINYLNANINVGYSNSDDRRHIITYDYGDLLNSYTTDKSKETAINSSANISYQWENVNNMIYGNISYLNADEHRDFIYNIQELPQDYKSFGTKTSGDHHTAECLNAEFYYEHTFANNREFCIDVINSFRKTNRDSYNRQSAGEGSAYDNYDVKTVTDNKIYTLILNAMFSSVIWNGNFSVSLSENYTDLRQNFTDSYFQSAPSFSHNSMYDTYARLSYSRNFGKLGTNISLMAINTHIRLTDSSTDNNFDLHPNIYVSYMLGNNNRLSLSTWIESSRNSLGKMNENRYFIDTRYFAENLPYENRVMKYNARLGASISIPFWNAYLSPVLAYHYTHHPYVDYIYREGNDFREVLLFDFSDWRIETEPH